MKFASFDAYIRAREREYVDELSALVRLPTVSAQRSAIDETARSVLERSRRAGFRATAERVAGGPPTIIGEQGAGERTLLVYDHYDVQPPDPLQEWVSPPFEPVIRDGFLFGRGTSDNKGNLTASAEDLALLAALPFDEEATKRIHGIKGFVGDLGGTALKARYFLGPTCTICGLTSGYQGEGSKTVLPAVASAKVDFRLVPDLTPLLVRALLRKHLDARGFTDVEITTHHGEAPSRWPADTAVARAAVRACRAAYGTEPVVYPIMAGSGPMAQVCDQLGIPAVGFGSGHAGSQNHAPNENIRIADYIDHIRAFGRFIHAFAGQPLD